MDTQTCPYCSETIQAGAKKCRHCGEWLEDPTDREGSAVGQRGSAGARAVARGIKQKQFDDMIVKLGVVVGIIAGAIAAYSASLGCGGGLCYGLPEVS